MENAPAGYPGIVDVAVIGVPSERWGETLKAVVVLAPGTDLRPEEIIEHARSRLARDTCPEEGAEAAVLVAGRDLTARARVLQLARAVLRARRHGRCARSGRGPRAWRGVIHRLR